MEISVGVILGKVTAKRVVVTDRRSNGYTFKANSIIFANLVARKDFIEEVKKTN